MQPLHDVIKKDFKSIELEKTQLMAIECIKKEIAKDIS